MIQILAVLCAVLASLGFNYTAYLQKVAVDRLPKVTFKFSKEALGVIGAFIKNKTWMTALVIMLVSSILYSVSLVFIEVSIVTPIVGSGVAFLAYLAIKNLGEKPRKIDLFAIGINISGVILIGVSLAEKISKGGADKALKFSSVAVWLIGGASIALALAIPILMRRVGHGQESVGLGISVGILYGMTAIFAKIVLYYFSKGMIFNVYVLGWLAVSVPAFIVWQAALQRGMAVIVVPIQAGLAQVVPILLGMIILGDKFPKSSILSAFRVLGFIFVLLGTVILSRRSEEVETSAGKSESPKETALAVTLRTGAPGGEKSI